MLRLTFWDWFLDDIMSVSSKDILPIVMLSVPFYVTYIISAFLDAWFISKGKTIYNMIISLIVNIVYYGIVYVLFTKNMFILNMQFIIFMFGIGMIVHMILSIFLYVFEKK